VFDDENVGGLQTLRHPVDAGLGVSMQPSTAFWIFGVASGRLLQRLSIEDVHVLRLRMSRPCPHPGPGNP
jgi:hypothetical protein